MITLNYMDNKYTAIRRGVIFSEMDAVQITILILLHT